MLTATAGPSIASACNLTCALVRSRPGGLVPRRLPRPREVRRARLLRGRVGLDVLDGGAVRQRGAEPNRRDARWTDRGCVISLVGLVWTCSADVPFRQRGGVHNWGNRPAAGNSIAYSCTRTTAQPEQRTLLLHALTVAWMAVGRSGGSGRIWSSMSAGSSPT